MANILVPAQVPWMVSPSTPYLHLTISEGETTEVQFVGYFAPKETEADKYNPLIVTIVPLSIDELEISDDKDSGPYQLIRMQFTAGLWARYYPSYSDTEDIDWTKYSRSERIPSHHEFQNVSEYLRWFKKKWKATNICPDPRFYEVIESDWLQEINSDVSNYHHFLILGHDYYTEIIARKWEWESLGVIVGF